MQTGITKEQFINLLSLALIFKGDVVTSSPDYLIEKFITLIGDPKTINKISGEGSLHVVFRQQIEVYLNYWEPKFIETHS